MIVELDNDDLFVVENGEKEGKEENDMVMIEYEELESCC